MKFLIVIACALAVASAGGVVAPIAAVYAGYGGPQHLPVIGPNGVPVDTAEVQYARAAHLAHKIEAHARNGDLAIAHAPIVAAHAAPVAVAHSAPVAVAHAAPVVAAHSYAHAAPIVAAHTYAHAAPIISAYAHHGVDAYPTTAVLPTSVNGVPLETPEVVAAKSNHFAAHAEALARNAHAHVVYRKRRGLLAAAPIAYSAPVVATYAHAPLATSYAYNHAIHRSAYAYPYTYAHLY